jgi:hypothetical protein
MSKDQTRIVVTIGRSLGLRRPREPVRREKSENQPGSGGASSESLFHSTASEANFRQERALTVVRSGFVLQGFAMRGGGYTPSGDGEPSDGEMVAA